MTRRRALHLAAAGTILGAGGSLLWVLFLAEWVDWILWVSSVEFGRSCQ